MLPLGLRLARSISARSSSGEMAPTTSCVTLSCKSKISSSAPSNRSAPQMDTCRGVDELSGNPHATTRLADAAFEHITHTKLASYLLDIDGLALVGEARIAGDNEKRLEPRKRRGDVLNYPIREKLLLRVTAQVSETAAPRWRACQAAGARELGLQANQIAPAERF